MNDYQIPIIKEYRIDRIIESLKCIDDHEFDRESQKECILRLYPREGDRELAHWDKSIFRGMVLPSLNHLGLILGENNQIRVSGNGALLIRYPDVPEETHVRAIRAVFLELDRKVFNFIPEIERSSNVDDLYLAIREKIDGPDVKQRNERIKRWIHLLSSIGLVHIKNDIIELDNDATRQADHDLDSMKKSMDIFSQCLFEEYAKLGSRSAGLVDISDLRKSTAVRMLKWQNSILTETQFDDCLRKISIETDDYLISYGKPMGATDRLFDYNGTLYRTIIIQSRKRM